MSSAAQGQRDPFADDVLERLIRSNQDYQRSHGHYIVPLAERLLAARAETERLREALTYYAEGRYPDNGETARAALGIGGPSCEELGYHVCGGLTHG